MADPDPRLPLSERVRPKKLAEIIGNRRAVDGLARWAAAWEAAPPAPRYRAAIVSGPPGVGKTSAALALAAEKGWALVEMNASDARNQTAIDQVAGRASLTHPLELMVRPKGAARFARTLILLDEADCLSGRQTEVAAARKAPTIFRDFLRTRYGSVEALVQSWGQGKPGDPKTWASWDQVPPGAPRGNLARDPSVHRDVTDWKEGESVHDTSDRGGLAAIARLVRSTRQPLILTVNDERALTRYSAAIRSSSTRIRFQPVPPEDVREILRRVSTSEGLRLTAEVTESIVRRSEGDLRAAINDLEAIAPLDSPETQMVALGGRDRSSEFEAFTGDLLTNPRFLRSVQIQERLDAPPDEIVPWMEENLPRFAPDARSRFESLEIFRRGERLLALARRYRDWSLWSYGGELVTGGAALALSRTQPTVRAYVGFPAFLGQMGRSRSARVILRTMLDKVGRRLHMSRRKSSQDLVPFLEAMFDPRVKPTGKLGRWRQEVVRELELTPEEVAFLSGTDIDSSIVQDALAAPGHALRSAPARRGEEAEASKPSVREPQKSTPARRSQRMLQDF